MNQQTVTRLLTQYSLVPPPDAQKNKHSLHSVNRRKLVQSEDGSCLNKTLLKLKPQSAVLDYDCEFESERAAAALQQTRPERRREEGDFMSAIRLPPPGADVGRANAL